MSALHAWLAHARDTPDKKGVHACGCLERCGHIILCDEGKKLRAAYIAEDISGRAPTLKVSGDEANGMHHVFWGTAK